MKINPYIGEILGPEYYHEVEGYDCRIAIRKLMDVYATLGDATVALTYANKDEYTEDTFEVKMMRRTHVRHAIIDLNNCFDLLMQIPWFFYRIGLAKCLDIQRNTPNWVQKLEEKCNSSDVITALKRDASDINKNTIGHAISDFKQNYILDSSKQFTVRTLVNYLKHKGVLKLKEFECPLNLDVELLGFGKIDKTKLYTEISTNFFSNDNPDVALGEIKIINKEYALIDINYVSGEKFRGEDYSYTEDSFGLEDIYKEAIDYHDAFIDLLIVVHKNLYEQIPQSPYFKKEYVKVKHSEVNIDKWYK